MFAPTTCTRCGAEGGSARYSMGIYYSRLCDPCWDRAGVVKGGREAFDPSDAGETYEDADDPSAMD